MISADVLALSSEAAVLVRSGRIQFANSAAKAILGEGCVGSTVKNVFGVEIAEAQAASIRAVAEALNAPGGKDTINMQLAQQYLKEFGNLAKTNNSMIVPADLANVAGILQACTSIIKKS